MYNICTIPSIASGQAWYVLLSGQHHLCHAVPPRLQLGSKQLVLFAVNDNEDVEQANGGSHWCVSLMAITCYAVRSRCG